MVSVPLPFLFCLHAISSIALTILNKIISSAIPLPLMIVAFQNLFGCILSGIFVYIGLLKMKPITLQQILQVAPVTTLFCIMLWSSFETLPRVTVPLLVIGRSCVPLATFGVERLMSSNKGSTDTIAPLITILAGAVLYAAVDTAGDASGFGFLMLNVFSNAVVAVLEKSMIMRVMHIQDPQGVFIIRNAISVFMLLFASMLNGEMKVLTQALNILSRSDDALTIRFFFFVTCFFGFSIGLCAFLLQAQVQASTMAVANTCYKLLTMLISSMVFTTSMSIGGLSGIILGVHGIIWYTAVRVNGQDKFGQVMPTIVKLSGLFAACTFLTWIISSIFGASGPKLRNTFND